MQLRLALAFTCFVSLCRAQVPDAAPKTAQLEYVQSAESESCPDEARLRRNVSELLGYDPFRQTAETQVSLEIRSQGSEFVADIRLRSAGQVTGERQLSAADCQELGGAAALAMALAIDPMLPSRQRAREKAKEQAKKSDPAPKPSPQPAPPPPPKAPKPAPAAVEPWRLRLGILGLTSFGSAPAPAVGVGALVGVRRGAISADLEVRRDLPAGKDLEPRGRVEASLSAVSLVPCYHHGVLGGCLLGTIGALQGEGAGVADPRKDTSLHAAAGARAGVEIPLTRAIAVGFFGDLRAPLTRTTLTVNGRDAWTMPALIPSLGLSLLGDFRL